MIGTLVGFAAPHAHVAAAGLLYRGLVIVPTLLVGAVGPLAFRLKPSAATAEQRDGLYVPLTRGCGGADIARPRLDS